tara:strand:- start:5740 stop:6327 length:588 start_codon:yes stop_codon:yes gene_type:complete
MEEYKATEQSWFVQKAQTLQARFWLVLLSFTESSVFVIPPDPLLAAMVFVRREKWLHYTLITAGASVAGAVFGYVIGAVLFDVVGAKIVEFYALEQHMENAVAFVNEGVFVFTATMAFTPIPFKVAVLAAGFTKANFLAFFVAAIGGRLARYAVVAYVAKVFGDNFDHIMKKIWWYATGAGGVILALYFIYLLVQ